jgi:ABC-type amino acid transport system permease subunit
MNYNWDWGVFFKSTGVGSETYLDWFISGLGWTIAIAVVAWIIALLLGSILGSCARCQTVSYQASRPVTWNCFATYRCWCNCSSGIS